MTRKWILLIGISLVTVIAWILVEVTMGYFSKEAELDYQSYTAPLSPTFKEESLEEILNREKEKLLIDRDALE